MLVINQMEVTQLLSMEECMNVVAESFKALARGDAIQPLRTIMWLPERIGALGLMPAHVKDIEVMGAKIISVFPGNQGTQYPSHQGAVILFETRNGRPLALIDASEITAIRTAAASGVATRLLARKEARTLAILGSGVQARTHLAAMLRIRPIERVLVWSRTLEHARAFAQRESLRHRVSVEAVPVAEAAVAEADIICTVTAATEPVLIGDWLPAGVHINAVGSSTPFARELDTDAVAISRLFVDRRESTLNEAGEFLYAKQVGIIDDDHIQGEIGELLLGEVQGRQTSEEITLFKSLGLAIEDIVAAHHVYQQGLKEGIGTRIALAHNHSSG